MQTQQEFEFYTPPQFSAYLDLETNTESIARNLLKEAREDYLSQIAKIEDEDLSSRQKKEDEIAADLAKTCMKQVIDEMQ